MKLRTWVFGVALGLTGPLLLGLGCAGRDAGGDNGDKPPAETKDGGKAPPALTAAEKKIEAARAKLSPADRALVDAQDYCVAMPEQKLGSMGVPIKLTVKGETVFVCCKGCKGTVEDDPDEMLKVLRELEAKKK